MPITQPGSGQTGPTVPPATEWNVPSVSWRWQAEEERETEVVTLGGQMVRFQVKEWLLRSQEPWEARQGKARGQRRWEPWLRMAPPSGDSDCSQRTLPCALLGSGASGANCLKWFVYCLTEKGPNESPARWQSGSCCHERATARQADWLKVSLLKPIIGVFQLVVQEGIIARNWELSILWGYW